MKKTKKLKIWGFIQLAIGLIILIVGLSMDPFSGGFFIIFLGGALTIFSIPILTIGFSPEIAKFNSKIKSETMDHAGEDIKEATSKTASVIIPGVTPSIKEAYGEIKGKPKSIEDELSEAESLLNKGVITKDEYEQMRKNIIGIK